MEFAFLTQPEGDKALAVHIEAAEAVARNLLQAVSTVEMGAALGLIAPIGGTSHAVDAVLTPAALELGFTSQRRDLFREYPTRLRPDWYRPLEASGILLEIERGKTLTNNMDLLDLWKCHICREADHLFLVVPMVVQRGYGVENVYPRVVTRMSTFMTSENKVNVASIAVFGY